MWSDRRPAAPLRRRLVLSTTGLGVVVALLLVVVVQAILESTAGSSVDRVLEDRADSVVRTIEVSRVGEVRVPDAALVPGVAVYDDGGHLVAGSAPPSQRHEFDELATSDRRTFHQDGDAYRVVAQPFDLDAPGPSGAQGVVVVSESLQPYEHQERTALLICIAAGAVIVALAAGLAAWASKSALAPVAQMARTAQKWSAHDLDRRFALGPPTDEIRALGQTLDGLLERVARAIADEQRLTSELAHELRTPLTAVQSTVELISLRPDLDEELRADIADLFDYCRAMGSTITSLLDLARAQAVPHSAAETSAEALLAEVMKQVRDAHKVTVGDLGGVQLAVPVEIALRALAPVVDNAARHGDHVRVTAERRGDLGAVVVADDGPGVAQSVREDLFEPGRTTGEGSGLGLALARRVARSAGGDVVLERSSDGAGSTFSVLFPLVLADRERSSS